MGLFDGLKGTFDAVTDTLKTQDQQNPEHYCLPPDAAKAVESRSGVIEYLKSSATRFAGNAVSGGELGNAIDNIRGLSDSELEIRKKIVKQTHPKCGDHAEYVTPIPTPVLVDRLKLSKDR